MMFVNVALAITLLFGFVTGTVEEGGTSTTATTVPVVVTVPQPKVRSLHLPEFPAELRQQMKTRKVPTIGYWDKVAQCETQQNWRDKGKWGGGLGMATTTWRNYGGYEFAKHPSEATKHEQILVANRVAVFGYQTKNTFLTLEDRQKNRPFFRPRAGFYGWGCIANNEYLKPTRKNIRTP